jgi:hypothetical protein
LSSSASTACRSSGRCNRLLDGSLKPPAIRGMVVFALCVLSPRSVTSGSPVEAGGIGSARIPPVAALAGAELTSSSASIFSMPVRRGSACAIGGMGRDGISCVFTIGFEMRRCSSSFCWRFLVRSSCQSL